MQQRSMKVSYVQLRGKFQDKPTNPVHPAAVQSPNKYVRYITLVKHKKCSLCLYTRLYGYAVFVGSTSCMSSELHCSNQKVPETSSRLHSCKKQTADGTRKKAEIQTSSDSTQFHWAVLQELAAAWKEKWSKLGSKGCKKPSNFAPFETSDMQNWLCEIKVCWLLASLNSILCPCPSTSLNKASWGRVPCISRVSTCKGRKAAIQGSSSERIFVIYLHLSRTADFRHA